MKKYLEAILFDFDGTLVNSEVLHFETLNELLTPYGYTYEWDYYLKHLAGRPAIHILKKVVAEGNIDIPLDQLVSKAESLAYAKLQTAPTVYMDGAIETLDFFDEKGLTLALVTGSDREMVSITFGKTELAKYFFNTVTSTDVVHTKPHPEPYLQSVDNLKIPAEDCIVIEDTLSGLTSAKDAGLTCIVVQHDRSLHAQLRRADKIFTTLTETREYIIENYEFSPRDQ